MWHKNKQKQRENKAHHAPKPQQKVQSPMESPILLWRKLPMDWGGPQQTVRHQKSIHFKYAKEINKSNTNG